MFIRAEDKKIYNSDYISVLQVDKVSGSNEYELHATLVKEASPDDCVQTVTLAKAASEEEAQAIADKIAKETEHVFVIKDPPALGESLKYA